MDILPHRHFKMKRITQVLPRRAVISRAGSGAEKSHSSMVQVPLRLEISRLRVSKEYNTFSLIPTRRSARDDVASPYCHLKMKRITQVLPRRAVISRAGSGAKKSPSSMVQAPLRLEISRLRVSMMINTYTIHSGMPLRSR